MTLIGTHVRNIHLVEQLGKGGMGEVFVGIDEVLGRKVAVKAIRTGMRPSATAKARFVREAQLLSQLEHPNICRIYEFIEGEEIDFIVLELVQGRTLSQLIGDDPPADERMAIALQVAEALRAAHSMSVVHRDLKPENIMVGSDGVVKVLDFGLARALPTEDPAIEASGSHTFDAADLVVDVDETSITELGQALGTPKYMSPEQARGNPLTAASDVYSFGLVLQELFTSVPPYPEDLGREQLFAKALWGDTRPVEGLDPELTRLIESMKSLGPGRRPTVEAVAEKLRWINDAPRRRRRRTVVSVVAALLVLAAVSSTIGFVNARRSQRAAESARAQAEAVTAFLQETLGSADPTVDGVEVKVVDVLDDAAWNLEVEFADRPLERAAVLNTLGATYAALGRYNDAHRHITTAYELRRTELGPSHRETLTSRKDLGRILYLQGDAGESETVLREVFETCERVLGPDDGLTLSIALELALTLSARGSYDEAETLLLRVVDGRRSVLGADDPTTLAAQEDLAVLIRRQGRYDEAEALHREILATKDWVFGEDHPLTANTVNNLASVLFRKADYEAAEELYRRVVELRRHRYGEDHPILLRAQGNVAITLSRQARYEEAEAVGQAQVEAQRRILGEEHPDTLMGENNLANTYRRWGKPEKAERIYRAVLERQRRIFGDEHPQTVRTLSNLAKTAQDMDRIEDSVELNRQVVDIRRRTLGDEHPFTLNNIYNLGTGLCLLERFEEGEALLREVFEVSGRTLGEDHQLTALAANGVSMVMASQGRVEEAIEFLSANLEIYRGTLGEEHQVTRTGIRQLADFYRSTGKTEEAEALEAELATASPS